MESKLGLNFELVNRARASAAKIADDTQHFIDQHTTVTVERAVCRLLGIDGVNDMDVPLPNVVVDHLMANSLLPVGAAWAIGNAMVETGKDPQGVADAVNSGELDLSKVPAHSDAEIRGAITPVVNATVDRINKNVAKRNSYLKAWGDKEGPYLYIIVATGNIYEDITQAKAGAKQGAIVDDVGGVVLGIAMLAGVGVEHELRQCAMQAGEPALQQREARTGNLGGRCKIELPECFTHIGVILDCKIEATRRSPAFDFNIAGLVAAERNGIIRHIGQRRQNGVEFLQ